MKKIDWPKSFKNTTNNLIVDIGCGLGVSLINLSSNSNASKVYDDDNDDYNHQSSSMELSSVNWPACNHAGTDLNSQLIGYANGVMSRRPINKHRVTFFNHAALEFLNELDSYPGKIKLISFHFPTSHIVDATIKDEEVEVNFTRGNAKLPTKMKITIDSCFLQMLLMQLRMFLISMNVHVFCFQQIVKMYQHMQRILF